CLCAREDVGSMRISTAAPSHCANGDQFGYAGAFSGLNDHTKVGVQVGSVAAMLLNQRHVRTSTFGFEEDMLEALAAGEIDAAAVTPLSAGWYNLNHPSQGFAIVSPDETAGDPVWNQAARIRPPDDKLRDAIDPRLDPRPAA